MFFKLCLNCEHFFFSDEEYRAHGCFRKEKKMESKKEVSENRIEERIPPAETAVNATAANEKEKRKQILLAMKTRLANAKTDCATLKYEATKEMYIKKFGAGEYTKLEQSFSGEMNNA